MRTFLILLIVTLTVCLSSTIINIPSDQPTIPAGINAAADGDTILIHPGTYLDNIDYNGKNIVIASLFYTTQDTSYISSTIIDGYALGPVVSFVNGEDSTAVLSGLTITNGLGNSMGFNYQGGGITCKEESSPTLSNLLIIQNDSPGQGGGIYVSDSSPVIKDSRIINNNGSQYGGGIYLLNSSAKITNNIIANNNGGNGGGLYVQGNSTPTLEDLTIFGNTSVTGGGVNFHYIDSELDITLLNSEVYENIANQSGGGINCANANIKLENVTVENNISNYGGGLRVTSNSVIELESVNIIGNTASSEGGGAHVIGSQLNFDEQLRCNIYDNQVTGFRGVGHDIYCDADETVHVVVDTFTVLHPSDYHLSPLHNFTYDILHGQIEQNGTELYVAEDGNNMNSGTSADEALQTIEYALSVIEADSLSESKIYLSPGTYSPSNTGESYPLEMISYVSLIGSGEEITILDAESNSRVVNFFEVENSLLKDLTIKNGESNLGGGIYTNNSTVNFEGVVFDSNISPSVQNNGSGGGAFFNNSSINLTDVIFKNNSAGSGGGIYNWYTDLTLLNVSIYDNSALGGGGIFFRQTSQVDFSGDCLVRNNSSTYEGGGIVLISSDIELKNLSVTQNSASNGGGIAIYESNPTFNEDDRISVFVNTSTQDDPLGADLYADNMAILNVFLDIFTVATPTNAYANPINSFTFDILNPLEGVIIDSDLYVAVDGDDSNSGTSAEEPLKTITSALNKVWYNRIIHLAPGVYSSATNGESFPINCRNSVSIVGSGVDNTILDADDESSVMVFSGCESGGVSDLTIQNGNAEFAGGGILCQNSDPILENLSITSNQANIGGGIHLFESSPFLNNIEIYDNSVIEIGGGLYTRLGSFPIMQNIRIHGNSSGYSGGGLAIGNYSQPVMADVKIYDNSSINGGGIHISTNYPLDLNRIVVSNNTATSGGGIFCSSTETNISNCSIYDNIGEFGSGIYCEDGADLTLINSVLWNDNSEEIFFSNTGQDNSAFICYTLIQGSSYDIETNNNGFLNMPTGNIFTNPLMADELGNLSDNSPCIDNGTAYYVYVSDVLIDLDESEYIGDAPDLGAVEWAGTDSDNEEVAVCNLELSNYPNPFNPSGAGRGPTTTISFNLPTEADVELTVYNVKGQKVKSIFNDKVSSGIHSLVWNGRDNQNNPVSSGIYLYKLKADKKEIIKRMVLLK